MSARTFVALGDSTSIAAEDATGHQVAYPYMLQVVSRGGIRLLKNAGVFGDRSEEMHARVSLDVLRYRPTDCLIMGYTNDSLAGYSVQKTLASHARIVEELTASGVNVICLEGPPLDTSAAMRQSQQRRNAAVCAWNERNGIETLKPWLFLTDPATGGYLAGTSADSIHPLNKLYAQAAKNIAAGLGVAPKSSVFSSASNAANKVSNGFFLLGESLPTGWNDISATTNVAASIAAPTGWETQPLGNSVTLSLSDTCTGQKTIRYLAAAGPNSTYRFSCRVKATGCYDGGMQWGVMLSSVSSGFSTGSTYRPVHSWINDLEGEIVCDFVTDSSAAYVSVGLYAGNAGATGGSVSFAQVGLDDVSDLGLSAATWPWI